MESRTIGVDRAEPQRIGLRAMGVGLAAALVVGAAAGYLAATLTEQRSAPASPSHAALTIPSEPQGSATTDFDRNSSPPAGLAAGIWGDRDSRLPVSSGIGASYGDASGNRDSRPPEAPFNGS